MSPIVLVHGWGYDSTIWDAVRARLDPALPVEVIDLGFFGATDAVPHSGYFIPPTPTFPEPVFAVGHSLGAMWWLTQTDIPWRRLLCINGFPRFVAGADYGPAVAPRVLARMRARLAGDPAGVLAEFHARCGAPGPTGTPDQHRLDTGLAWLAEWDARVVLAKRCADVFALAGTDDPIVPAAMSTAAFAALPPEQFMLVPASGPASHVLPVTAPDECARWIERLAA
jgi:pimeloyl-[acyl-carrier protein] methyl ester esterase